MHVMNKDGTLDETGLDTEPSCSDKTTESDYTSSHNDKSSTAHDNGNNESIADSDELGSKSFVRSSANSNFLCVAQFICVFGPLLGIPKISLDVLEDGLDKDKKTVQDLYFDACSNAVERLVISLLRRCGHLTNTDKLSETLSEYFDERDHETLACALEQTSYRDLPSTLKLEILKDICMNQFDDNSKFKSDFNAQYSSEELRFKPLGRDFDSSQYWFIEDHDHSHRLYRWKYPYSEETWCLVSSYLEELQKLCEHMTPPDVPELRDGKLGEVWKQELEPVPDKPAAKKRPKKDNFQKAEERNDEEDKNVQFRVRKKDIKARKSSRNVNRKVYTEPNEENATSEDEPDTHKEFDDKCKIAINIAQSRKRTKKFLTATHEPVHTTKHYLSTPPLYSPPPPPSTETAPQQGLTCANNTQYMGHVTHAIPQQVSNAQPPDGGGEEDRKSPVSSFHHQILLPKAQQTPLKQDIKPDTEEKNPGTTADITTAGTTNIDITNADTTNAATTNAVKTEPIKAEPASYISHSSHLQTITTKNCTIEIIPKHKPQSNMPIYGNQMPKAEYELPLSPRALADSFLNIDQSSREQSSASHTAPLVTHNVDPFAFPVENSAHSPSPSPFKGKGNSFKDETSQSDPFEFCPTDLHDKIKGGMFHCREYTCSKRKPPRERVEQNRSFLNSHVRTKPLKQQVIRKSKTQCDVYRPEPVFDPEFIQILATIPSIRNYQKPKEAKDICWKCNSEEHVDKMLFCDGCDLATYHMACLSPPIEEVPDDDWFCPVCEQCLLYLRLRHKLQTITAYTRLKSQLKPRKSYNTPKKVHSNNNNSIQYYKPSQYSPTLPRKTPTTHRIAVSTSNHCTAPARPLKQYITIHKPAPKPPPKPKPRPKISQIERLAETAKRVYEHDVSDEDKSSEDSNIRIFRAGNERQHRRGVGGRPGRQHYTEDTTSSGSGSGTSETDEDIVTCHPDDLEDSEEETTSRDHLTTSRDHRRPPNISSSKIRGYSSSSSSSVRPKYLIYNPHHIRHANSRYKKHRDSGPDQQAYTADDFLAEPPSNSSPSNSLRYSSQNTLPLDMPDAYRIQKPQRKFIPYEEYEYKAPKSRVMSITYDEKEYIRSKSGTNSRNSRSGNVVTETAHLTDQQKKALAAWEEMEKKAVHDEYEFVG